MIMTNPPPLAKPERRPLACSASEGAGSGEGAGPRLKWRAHVLESGEKAEIMGLKKAPVQGHSLLREGGDGQWSLARPT